ncbi:MAG: hypothetical protein AB7V42_06695 [Thermoleophilia bacterium]
MSEDSSTAPVAWLISLAIPCAVLSWYATREWLGGGIWKEIGLTIALTALMMLVGIVLVLFVGRVLRARETRRSLR